MTCPMRKIYEASIIIEMHHCKEVNNAVFDFTKCKLEQEI
ncbi:MAG: hypothetical protein ACI9QN_001161 [Arcticibacterium sp.]|jgi:hypothetical protein